MEARKRPLQPTRQRSPLPSMDFKLTHYPSPHGVAMNHELGRVIAERSLTLESEPIEKILVRLGEPQALPSGDFYCAFEILRGADRESHAIYGLDPFQALQLSLRHLASFLHHYNRTQVNGRLYWFERGDDLGFPEKVNSN